jgi:hypothetical protein
MYFGYALLSYIIFSSVIFAQNFSKASANIKVKLVNGVFFQITNASLDFSVLLDSSKSLLEIKQSDGIGLHVSTIKSVSVLISYANVAVNKINDKEEKADSQKSSEGSLLFQPRIQRFSNLTNENAVDLINGSAFAFNDEKKDNSLDLWIGGVLSLPYPSEEGIYSKTFALSLVYF